MMGASFVAQHGQSVSAMCVKQHCPTADRATGLDAGSAPKNFTRKTVKAEKLLEKQAKA